MVNILSKQNSKRRHIKEVSNRNGSYGRKTISSAQPDGGLFVPLANEIRKERCNVPGTVHSGQQFFLCTSDYERLQGNSCGGSHECDADAAVNSICIALGVDRSAALDSIFPGRVLGGGGNVAYVISWELRSGWRANLNNTCLGSKSQNSRSYLDA